MRVALRPAVALAAVLYAAAAFAQSAPPPMVGDKPLVQVKPHKAAAKPAASAKNQSTAVKLQACLEIDDGTKERLNCYDEVIKPEPKEKAATAKRVIDCKFSVRVSIQRTRRFSSLAAAETR